MNKFRLKERMDRIIEKDFRFISREDGPLGASLSCSVGGSRVFISGDIHEREVPELIKWLQSLGAEDKEE